MKRLRLLGLLFFLGSCVAFPFGLTRFLTRWIPNEIKNEIPFPSDLGPARIRWPLGVTIEGIKVFTPSEIRRELFFEVGQLTLQMPWWGFFLRPIPVEATLTGPALVLDSNTTDLLGNLIYQRVQKAGWVPAPSPLQEEEEEGMPWEEEPSRQPPKPSRFLLGGIQIQQGKVDFMDRVISPDRPVLSIGDLEVKAQLSGWVGAPSLGLKGKGNFLSSTGDRIGFLTVESLAYPTLGQMEGKMQLWHGRLEDFRWIYFYAPQPFFFEKGAGGPTFQWRIKNRNELWVSMRCLAEDLQIEGMIGEVPWQSVLKALEVSPGKLDMSVFAQGRLDDPTFDVHNRLLSELDWAMKEHAAQAGILIPGRIFFGLERPESEEEEEEEEEPLLEWESEG